MIETITFTEMVKWILGSLVFGFVIGMLVAVYLIEVYDKKKGKKNG